MWKNVRFLFRFYLCIDFTFSFAYIKFFFSKSLFYGIWFLVFFHFHFFYTALLSISRKIFFSEKFVNFVNFVNICKKTYPKNVFTLISKKIPKMVLNFELRPQKRDSLSEIWNKIPKGLQILIPEISGKNPTFSSSLFSASKKPFCIVVDFPVYVLRNRTENHNTIYQELFERIWFTTKIANVVNSKFNSKCYKLLFDLWRFRC